jgi:hypothetical protein
VHTKRAPDVSVFNPEMAYLEQVPVVVKTVEMTVVASRIISEMQK